MPNDIFDELYCYYQSSRGTGHTILIEKGIFDYNSNFYLVASSHTYAKNLARHNKKAIPITLVDITNYKMRGTKYPIIFDNSAIIKLIDEHDAIIKEFQEMTRTLNTIIFKLETELRQANKEIDKLSSLGFWKKLQSWFNNFINLKRRK